MDSNFRWGIVERLAVAAFIAGVAGVGGGKRDIAGFNSRISCPHLVGRFTFFAQRWYCLGIPRILRL
jgi:hypothetical protein